MRNVAIIGAGQAGLVLGFGLLEVGYSVTLFSDRTPDALLQSKPTGLAVLFDPALQIERHLGLNFWEPSFSGSHNLHTRISGPDGNPALTLSFDLDRPWQAIDQRLKFSRWMQEFVKRGGKLVVQEMTLADMEHCAQAYDLVVVAAGKGALANLFQRDAQRSTHNKPARQLAGGIFTGLSSHPTDSHTFQQMILPGIGEIFHQPFYCQDGRDAYAIGFEAYPGGPMDQFDGVQTGQDLVKLSIQLIEQFAPWNAAVVQGMQLLDDRAWLCGAITPVVRHPVGRLPSGAIVMGIGDTVILNDPVAGQGANNATKMAHLVTQRVIKKGDRPFDAGWMQAVFEEFWLEAQYANRLSDCFLMPQAHHQEVLVAASHNPDVARDYLYGISHPSSLFPWFFIPEATQNYLVRRNAPKPEMNLRSEELIAA
jgi:2-polyprenyl-6-methoxyphenol hydroxylase-like FAD-dependent oxidoreductase